MKFSIEFTLLQHGWLNLLLEGGGHRYETDTISYLSDAFGDFTDALYQLLEGVSETKCILEHEPGETRLRFVCSNDNLKISVYAFDETFEKGTWEDGRLLKDFDTTLLRLKSQYLRQADLILSKFGVDGYMSGWGHPFPMERYLHIKTKT